MKGMNKEKINIRLSYFTFSARTGTGANYTAMGIEVTARAYGNYDVKYYATVKTDFLKSPAWNHAGGAWSWSELILPYKPSFLWLWLLEYANLHIQGNTDCKWCTTHSDGVDVRLVAWEALLTGSLSDIPEFSGGITGSGYKALHVGSQRETHHITGMTSKVCHLLACLYIPQCTVKTSST